MLNILKNDFRPRFGLEDFSSLKPNVQNFSYAFPMSCFCDLPLSNTSKHLATYGNYGIGLTKKWGKKNGLNPILYLHKDSNLWIDIDTSIVKIITDAIENKHLTLI